MQVHIYRRAFMVASLYHPLFKKNMCFTIQFEIYITLQPYKLKAFFLLFIHDNIIWQITYYYKTLNRYNFKSKKNK